MTHVKNFMNGLVQLPGCQLMDIGCPRESQSTGYLPHTKFCVISKSMKTFCLGMAQNWQSLMILESCLQYTDITSLLSVVSPCEWGTYNLGELPCAFNGGLLQKCYSKSIQGQAVVLYSFAFLCFLSRSVLSVSHNPLMKETLNHPLLSACVF